MTKWYVKKFSKLTNTSVRTLHHYDKIGLLKPSVRLSTGYRLYSESDLFKLEQIIALKFFGFDLKKIKMLVESRATLIDHLELQQKFLQEQINYFKEVSQILNDIIKKSGKDRSVDWNNIVKLIGVYRMKQDLKKSWEGQVYNDEQLKQFAELKQKYTERENVYYQKRWEQIVALVKENLDQDPTGHIGQSLAREWLELVDEVYGDYPELKYAMVKAYRESKIPGAPFDKAVYDWIEKAAKAAKLKF